MRRPRWTAAAVLACLLAPAVALAGPFRKGPYLQSVTRTSITLMWQADPPAAGTVYVAAPGEPERAIEVSAAGVQEVVVDGLLPARRYRYRVVSGGEEAGGEFATAPGPSEPFSFVVFGDTRSNAGAHRGVVERVRREVPDFLLVTGDFVDDGGKESDWQEFFEIERALLRENVLYPAVGNHDRQGKRRTVENYRRYFATPPNSPNPERYYAFTYGNSRFLVLDSNEYSFALTDQTAWVEKELAKAAADPKIAHRFVVMHHPPYSTAIHGGNAELRDMWTPLFVRYGVDAVFSGHDHTYERAEKDGVRYFVTGGGGAPLYPRDARPSTEDLEASIVFERTHHYLRVHVVGGFVEVAVVRADGSLIESLSWGSLPERRIASASPPPAPPPPAVASPLPPSSPVERSAVGCAVGAGAARGTGGALTGLALAIALLALLRRRRSHAAR